MTHKDHINHDPVCGQHSRMIEFDPITGKADNETLDDKDRIIAALADVVWIHSLAESIYQLLMYGDDGDLEKRENNHNRAVRLMSELDRQFGEVWDHGIQPAMRLGIFPLFDESITAP